MSSTATKLLTAEEFFQWAQMPTNRGHRFELRAGEVVEMPPPGKFHGFVCGNVSRILGNYAILRRTGYVCTNDAGVIVGRDPDSVRGPDITFYEDDQSATDMERQYATAPPLLAVEVVSLSDRISDRINEVMLRVRQLLDRGVKVVWVIDPEARDISVCEVGQQPQLVRGDQPIEGGKYLAEFRCLASEFFALPGR